jgi:polyhydroxyalkanoate synthesis repressor PhaR
MAPILIKKYGNRRLYDTADSRYITLEELAGIIQSGAEVRVVDAKSGADLTQATLTQIIVESRDAARMLPVPLLTQLIRLGDDALAEFLGRYVSGALEMYLQARRGLQAAAVYNPFAQVPLSATEAMARMWMASPFGPPPPSPSTAPHNPAPPTEPPDRDELAQLRREIDELKRSVQGQSATKKRRR